MEFSMLTLPLCKLTSEDVPFCWDAGCEQIFRKLKKKLTTTPVLEIPDLNQPYELICSESKKGFSSLLMQNGQTMEMYLSS